MTITSFADGALMWLVFKYVICAHVQWVADIVQERLIRDYGDSLLSSISKNL